MLCQSGVGGDRTIPQMVTGLVMSVDWYIPILSQTEPLHPLARASLHKTAKICLEALIDSFFLAIRLRVVGQTHAESGLRKMEQLLLEQACEDTVSV